MFGGNSYLCISHPKSQELASCVQLPAKRECHTRASILLCIAVPQDHTDFKRTWAIQGLTRGHKPHISSRKQSPTANIILPTQSRVTLLFTFCHTHTTSVSCTAVRPVCGRALHGLLCHSQPPTQVHKLVSGANES